jgi:hypothetical protein
MEWLAEFLGSRERPLVEVCRESKKPLISAKSLYAAKKALKIKESGKRGSKKWAMPPKQIPKRSRRSTSPQ